MLTDKANAVRIVTGLKRIKLEALTVCLFSNAQRTTACATKWGERRIDRLLDSSGGENTGDARACVVPRPERHLRIEVHQVAAGADQRCRHAVLVCEAVRAAEARATANRLFHFGIALLWHRVGLRARVPVCVR